MGTYTIPLKPRICEINWMNPITRGLVFDTPFFEGAGAVTENDILFDLSDIGTIVASGATWDRNLYGWDLDFSAAASSVSFTSLGSVNTLTRLSVEAFFTYRSDGGGGLGRLIHKKNNSAAYWDIQAQTGTIRWVVSGTGNGAWPLASALTTNVWYHLVVTYDTSGGFTTAVPIIYLNAISQSFGGSTQPTGTQVADDTNLYIGNRGDGIRNWDGKISYARVWNRVLSQSEVNQLYANPFRIYKTPKLLTTNYTSMPTIT